MAGSYFVARNTVQPTPTQVVQRTITAQRAADQPGWLVLHVVSEECGYSRSVLDHLLASHRPSGVFERIVLVSDRAQPDAEGRSAIRDHGFDLDVVAPEQLFARYAIDVVPAMAILDPSDRLRYLGGYAPRSHADLLDISVIDAVRHDETVEPLPTFGCPVGGTLALAEPRGPGHR